MPSIYQINIEWSLEVTKIYSIPAFRQRPDYYAKAFRSPHHTTSHIGLIGGSATPKPGEISLAHRGIFILDEFRIQDTFGSIKTTNGRRFCSNFEGQMGGICFLLNLFCLPRKILPCGYFGDPTHDCKCMPGRFRATEKISGQCWIELIFIGCSCG